MVHSFGFAANAVAPGDDHRKKPPLVGRARVVVVVVEIYILPRCVWCCVRGAKAKSAGRPCLALPCLESLNGRCVDEGERERENKDRSMDPIRSGSRPIQCLLLECVCVCVKSLDGRRCSCRRVPERASSLRRASVKQTDTFLCRSGSKAKCP